MLGQRDEQRGIARTADVQPHVLRRHRLRRLGHRFELPAAPIGACSRRGVRGTRYASDERG